MRIFPLWSELYLTQDIERFLKVSILLKNAGIAHKEKIQNVGHENRRNGHIGSLGESASLSNIYQIYVRKADVEKAKALITQNFM